MILSLPKLSDRGVYSACLYVKWIVLSQGDVVIDESVLGAL